MISRTHNFLSQRFARSALCRECLNLVHAIKPVGFLFLITMAISGCANHWLKQLPPFQDNIINHEYKVEPYIRAAVTLQAMGSDRACQHMIAIAKRDEKAEQIFILCRMLFIKRGTAEFRSPWIGNSVFLGGTDSANWSLDPIELVNGVPFIIRWDYTLHGMRETPEQYLNYCMTNCDWTTFKFQMKSHNELNEALNKLLVSSKWKRPLEPQEHEIIAKQIE